MYHKYNQSSKSWKDNSKPLPTNLSTDKNWFKCFFQKIKNLIPFVEKDKLIYHKKKKTSTKVVPFYHSHTDIEIKNVVVNKLPNSSKKNLSANIQIDFFTKEKTIVQVSVRGMKKGIIHLSSHLVRKGEQNISINLLANTLSDEIYFLQIKDQKGKIQRRKLTA